MKINSSEYKISTPDKVDLEEFTRKYKTCDIKDLEQVTDSKGLVDNFNINQKLNNMYSIINEVNQKVDDILPVNIRDIEVDNNTEVIVDGGTASDII